MVWPGTPPLSRSESWAAVLSDKQFRYLIRHEPMKEDTTVVALQGEEPVGTIGIVHDPSPSREQRHINQWADRGASHGTGIDFSTGQMRWTEGAFKESTPPFVGWASLTRGANPAHLRNMLGLAIREIGTVPMADSQLTPQGSAFARSMAKKFGAVRGHPDNPSMAATHEPLDDWIVEDSQVGALESHRISEREGGPAREASRSEIEMAKSLFWRPLRRKQQSQGEQLRLF